MRKLRDTEVPSRTWPCFCERGKRQKNSLADMTHGERKLQDESTSACYIFNVIISLATRQHDDDDAERAVFQRRATETDDAVDYGHRVSEHKLTQPMCNRAKLNTNSNTQGAGDSGAAIEETKPQTVPWTRA